jgi:glycosyltransferase involved in cell wall biosynthesis
VSRPLRVCLDARLVSGTAGGVEQVVIGLASGFSKLIEDSEEYLFLSYAGADDWIRPYVSGRCRLLHTRHPLSEDVNRPSAARKFLRKARPISDRWKLSSLWSDGAIENAGVDVMHFTHQIAFRTRVPSVYQPHDLQHLHFPEFYSLAKRLIREVVYRSFCKQATIVAAQSSWLKDDLIRHYKLPPGKVCVVPWAPVLSAYPEPNAAELRSVQTLFDLPARFLLYPAQTWPHKNHLRLVDAVAILRDRHGLDVTIVCTGGRVEPHFSAIRASIESRKLEARFRFPGFVTAVELNCLYRLCDGVVIPSLFESASFPLWEAFASDRPAACSRITSLPAQACGAALLFDPLQSEEIAGAIAELWLNETVRRRLVASGRLSVSRFSWDRTVRAFRAHYRRIAGRVLSDEDRGLLAEEPLL